MFTREEAVHLDSEDPLNHLRLEFTYPTKQDLRSSTLADDPQDDPVAEQSLYLCGNSLGLQPKRTAIRIQQHLTAWAKKGVHGHFKKHVDSNLQGFLHLDAQAAEMMAPLLGASTDEVAIAETLTANLHFLMASFYRPTPQKHKIIIEGKAFPSDHYAVESQTRYHGFDPRQSMICIEPESSDEVILSTSHICEIIDTHASTTAMILLPGIQYYTGQLLDIKAITECAHRHEIVIGWDLAHAVGNVELHLHDWEVDFAAWCNYKYVNAGPGAVAGFFVHSTHGVVDGEAMAAGRPAYRPRLAGWWGGDKAIRFEMGPDFVPIPGAQGFQLGNPSSLAICALIASLEVFQMTSMPALRRKSMALTGYMERLLLDLPSLTGLFAELPYSIITPHDPVERGSQLSIRIKHGLLATVLHELEQAGVVVDERKPDVVRVAPVPLYNTFQDVWDFVGIFTASCKKALEESGPTSKANNAL